MKTVSWKFSNEQLDKSFIIGPPYPTKPSVSTYYRYDSKNRAIPFEISQAGYTSKELEDMDLCGIYECEI